MKALLTSALVMMVSFSAFSQDTLFTRNGQVIPGKVYEINQTDIKYRKPSNPDGPLYTISKEDVTMIEYKNGTKDVFQSQRQQTTSQAQTRATDDVYATGTPPQTQVNNNYYGAPVARPGVNVVLGMGLPYWGGGWGGYRPYYRPYYGGYYGGGWGGCGHHYGHRRH
jgi:hypothetical protein